MMSENISLYIYDTNFNLVDIVDEWISLIWKSVFNGDVGGFDLQVPATKENIKIFKPDFFVERSDKHDWQPVAKAQGGKSMMQCRDIMIIEAIEIQGSMDEGTVLTVGGVHITSLLKRRINVDPFTIFGNEYDGYWGKMSQGLIYDDVSSSLSLQVDHRRGLPIQKLLSFDMDSGGIYDAEHLGFLTTFSSRAQFENVISPRRTSGFHVGGYSVFMPDDAININVYIPPDYHWVGVDRVIKTTDGQYLIGVGVSVQVGGGTTEITYYPLSKAPPYPTYPVTEVSFTFAQMTTAAVHNASEYGHYYKCTFLEFDTTPPIILTDDDVGAAFVPGTIQRIGGRHVGIITSATHISDESIVVGGTVLLYGDGYTIRNLFQSASEISRDSWFGILSATAQSNDVGLSLYYDDTETNNKLKFAIYDGEDRNISFSSINENLVSYKNSADLKDYANVAYIVGTYPANPADENIKEIDLVTYTPASAAEDMLRREVVIDSDASYKSGDYIISIDSFRKMLTQEGSEVLAQDHTAKNEFECEVIADNSLFILDDDYFIGDKVFVSLPTGDKYKVRIQETTESWDNEGYKVQLKLKYISEEDSTQLLTAESGDLITDEDGNNIEVEGAEYGEY